MLVGLWSVGTIARHTSPANVVYNNAAIIPESCLRRGTRHCRSATQRRGGFQWSSLSPSSLSLLALSLSRCLSPYKEDSTTIYDFCGWNSIHQYISHTLFRGMPTPTFKAHISKNWTVTTRSNISSASGTSDSNSRHTAPPINLLILTSLQCRTQISGNYLKWISYRIQEKSWIRYRKSIFCLKSALSGCIL